MIFALLLYGPVALYLILVALRPGRGAVAAFAILAAVLLLIWLARPLGWWPRAVDPTGDAFLMVVLGFWTLAVVLAGVAQAARERLAARGPWVYPLAAAAVLAVLLVSLAPLLGF